jgi:hypothetical protein
LANSKTNCVYSPIEISTKGGSGTVSTKATATETYCTKKGGCKTRTVTAVTTFSPTVLAPTDIDFKYPALHDADGYDAKNLDGTYYVWDIIGIQHIPVVPHKESRFGTLTFETTVTPPLPIIQKKDCELSKCTLEISGNNMSQTYHHVSLGEGVTAFDTPSLSVLGKHQFVYTTKLFNMGRYIATLHGIANAIVVDYHPEYAPIWPYLALDSEGTDSFQKRHGIGMHYLGSRGGGPGDDNLLHSDRRSKINWYYYAMFGKSLVSEYKFINTALSQYGGKDVLEKIPYPSVGKTLDPKFPDMVKGVQPSLISKTDNTAVFQREGFGRLYVKFEGLRSEVDKKLLVNATVFGTPISNEFAGHDVTFLKSYTYLFPHLPTGLYANFTAIHSNGTKDNTLPITASLVPVFENRTEFIPRYFQGYAQFSGIEAPLAALQIADVHDISNIISAKGASFGYLNKSIIYIPYQTHSYLGIQNTSKPILPDFISQFVDLDKNSFFKYPEFVSLNLPGVYSIQASANNRTNAYPAEERAFYGNFSKAINADMDNSLKVRRIGANMINAIPHENFGTFSKISVNGFESNRDCRNGCIFVVDNGPVGVQAENEWGGIAAFRSEKPNPIKIESEAQVIGMYIVPQIPYIFIAVLFLIFFLLIQKFVFKRRG